MKPLYKFFAFFFLILLLGFFISPTNKTEIFFGALIPFIASIIEVFLLLRAVKVDLMMTTKILMIGFVLKMVFFAPYLLGIIYFYSFNTHSFVFSFLGSFIAFHTLEAVLLNTFFNKNRSINDFRR